MRTTLFLFALCLTQSVMAQSTDSIPYRAQAGDMYAEAEFHLPRTPKRDATPAKATYKDMTAGATNTGRHIQMVQNGRSWSIYKDQNGQDFIVVERPTGFKRVYLD